MVSRQSSLMRSLHVGLMGTGVLAALACSPLEPMIEPEVSDLQLTVDTLKTSVRDAQRTIAELRAELEARRQELADAQIARAQLEGRVREAERRLLEARQVIDLQREELASSRAERERVAKTGAVLHRQMKQLQQQLSKLGKASSESRAGIAPAAFPPAARRPGPARTDAAVMNGVPVREPQPTAAPARIVIKPGDTLWSIAQRYHVPLKRLMAFNQLADPRIEVGQALWLVDPTRTPSE